MNKTVKKAITAAVLVFLLLILLANSTYIVREDEVAAVSGWAVWIGFW